MEYLIILALFLFSAIILEYQFHIHLYNSRKERILIPLIFLVAGTAWDSFAIWRGHWSFQGPGLIGIEIGLMPLEEYLFLLIIPFWIITIYKLLDKKLNYKKQKHDNKNRL